MIADKQMRIIEWLVAIVSVGLAVGATYGTLNVRVSSCEEAGKTLTTKADLTQTILMDIRERLVRIETKLEGHGGHP